MPERPGDPCIVVIFGASGDLTKRKLLPALLNLSNLGLLSKDFAIVGVARTEYPDEGFRDYVSEQLTKMDSASEADYAQFRKHLFYVSGQFDEAATYDQLGKLLKDLEDRFHTRGNALFYLATPPSVFVEIAGRLGNAGLLSEGADSGARWRRLIIEKPFGRDLESARALNAKLTRCLAESQIYRIDHYLGKETVQNIMVLRLGNGILEPIWNRRYIDHVQITVAESLGIEMRGEYYEQSGVLRDVIQNHMFMLLAMIAMEPPGSLAPRAIANEKVKLLDAVARMTPDAVRKSTVRGQYGEGYVDGAPAKAYRDEKFVSPASQIETFAALELRVDNWRWADVPFYLRSGKRMATRSTDVVIQFKQAPLHLFGTGAADQAAASRLILHIQPEEGITLEMLAKVPGPQIRAKPVKLNFDYSQFGALPPATGYETLIYDCMIGDASLFHRADMVESAWQIATPILDAWEEQPPPDFPNYEAGSWGPPAADLLMEAEHREWWNAPVPHAPHVDKLVASSGGDGAPDTPAARSPRDGAVRSK